MVWNDVRGYGILLRLRLHTVTVARHGIIRPSTGQMLLFAWMAKRPRHGAVSTSTFRRMKHLAACFILCRRWKKQLFWREHWFLRCPMMWIPILVEQKDQRYRLLVLAKLLSFSKCSPYDPGVCAKQLEVSKVRMLILREFTAYMYVWKSRYRFT